MPGDSTLAECCQILSTNPLTPFLTRKSLPTEEGGKDYIWGTPCGLDGPPTPSPC